MKSAHVVLALAVFGASLLESARPLAEPIDQSSIYGGTDRAADPSLRQADDTLVKETTRAAAWTAVKLARQNGGKVPETFLQRLRDKMPEPE